MCFSSTASFGSSTALLVIGIISMKNSGTGPQKVLSSVPLMLSVQQLLEGIVWLSLMNPGFSEWGKPATYGFLIFAQVIWPVFIPLSIFILEKVPNRKKILFYFMIAGMVQALYLSFGMLMYPASSEIMHSHIRYDLDFPGANRWFGGALYIIATGVSPFISSIKMLRLMGVIVLSSYLFTRILYEQNVISVWCYFAALISFVVLAVILRSKKEILVKGSIATV
ncbi:MAG: DUF6629 family protein [Pedobacter sp.]|jgi:hypothetical protein